MDHSIIGVSKVPSNFKTTAPRQSPRPSLTVGLLNRPRLKSVARASARAVPQRNDLWDFDGTVLKTAALG